MHVYPLKLNLQIPIVFHKLCCEALGILQNPTGSDTNTKKRAFKSIIHDRLRENGIKTEFINIFFIKTNKGTVYYLPSRPKTDIDPEHVRTLSNYKAALKAGKLEVEHKRDIQVADAIQKSFVERILKDPNEFEQLAIDSDSDSYYSETEPIDVEEDTSILEQTLFLEDAERQDINKTGTTGAENVKPQISMISLDTKLPNTVQ